MTTKTITAEQLNGSIEKACEVGRVMFGWDDAKCMEFSANMMERLDREGWKIVEG